MKRRPRRSAPAAVVAIQLILGERPWISYDAVATTLHGQHWSDLLPAIAGGVTAALGLVLLLAAILPGAPTVLPLNGPFDAGAARGSYRSTLRAAAARVDGLADAVRAAVDDHLDRIAPATRPAVTVRIRAPRRAE
ncbi:DUF6286 domain-containing protein [Amycolatopsis australiensis]|uniref:DUF6286 domain-containing protein n=1 Tax=Amycolatopsis australiensis TaxID=546364 RepID=A0A1K1RF65_9PSEU|nr:DUF6286 domain-containing protein [Amycolatopsis australiensis]SFW70890.1 hypothetical protein SAMN04489730_3188 [Amycolatopsis australiensis]